MVVVQHVVSRSPENGQRRMGAVKQTPSVPMSSENTTMASMFQKDRKHRTILGTLNLEKRP